MQRYELTLGAIAFAITALASPAAAAVNCGYFDGTWRGTMQGSINGGTAMTISACSVAWQLPSEDGRVNECTLRERKGQVEYKCSLGSRGVVQANGNSLTFQNVYTAKQHGAYTVRVNRQ
ncbi:hypothetical protein KDD17_11400 [Sulfitobacter albidus]|uniref:DUF3617 family protein n=1 Tax=Sulfitobacter albidus TaxID=2829501 RepID=A0A975JBR6_9RHOB|nr:hypothetical protein [Sulfitobacter albidus]QUJ75564.1 hypothetical protein KDD17_11400 [Sulfitobacter albidus]